MKVIKRISAACLVVALICFTITSTSYPTAAASADYADLMKLITDSEDVRIDARDLAFLLVTHGLDASPEDGCVIVKLDDAEYSITPNGEKPGLADISTIDEE